MGDFLEFLNIWQGFLGHVIAQVSCPWGEILLAAVAMSAIVFGQVAEKEQDDGHVGQIPYGQHGHDLSGRVWVNVGFFMLLHYLIGNVLPFLINAEHQKLCQIATCGQKRSHAKL